MPRVAVCLSGCGFKDGAEIHESVLTFLALDQAGAEIVCCAPDIDQPAVVDHLTATPQTDQKRNVLIESARIARGNIIDIAALKADEIDALIFPGGMGAAQNLSTFASEGPDCTVHPEVERLAGQMLEAGKPIGAICIAPAMLARVLSNNNIQAQITIGTDKQTATALEKMGVKHVDCPCDSCVADKTHKIVTTPAYMLGQGPSDIFEGIKKLVDEVLSLTQNK